MLKELLLVIAGMAVDASGLQVVDLPKEPAGTYGLFNKKTSEFTKYKGEPSPRQYRARHLPDFIHAVIDLTKVEGLKQPKVFITTSGLVAVMDENGRRECLVRMDFTQTKTFKTLLACEAQRSYKNHKEFMRMLRLDLDLGTDPAYAQFKVLKFRGESDNDSDISKTNASMGKQVTLRATTGGAGEIPDSIVVHFPLYEELNLEQGEDHENFKTQSVEVLIDVDLEDQVIAAIPRQSHLTIATSLVFEAVRDALDKGFDIQNAPVDGVIPIYIGSPG